MGLQSVVGKLWYLKLIIALNLSADLASAQNETVGATPTVDLTFLQKVCAVDSDASSIVSLPNDLCTAIASYSNESQSNAEVIKSFREQYSIPFVHIYNTYTHEELVAAIKADKVEEFITTICTLIKDTNINALVLDNLYPASGQAQDKNLQVDFTEFVKKIREVHPTVLIGMALTKNTEILNACEFDVVKLNELVDFYLIKAHSYRECLFEENQSAMSTTSPIDDMNKTLSLLISLNYDIHTTVLVIDVRAVISEQDCSKVDESYTNICLNEPNATIKYCGETLENFYKKGALVSEFGMTGFLVRSVNRDDYDNTCLCGNYAATTVIDIGACGKPESIDIICCKTFAVFSNATQ